MLTNLLYDITSPVLIGSRIISRISLRYYHSFTEPLIIGFVVEDNEEEEEEDSDDGGTRRKRIRMEKRRRIKKSPNRGGCLSNRPSPDKP